MWPRVTSVAMEPILLGHGACDVGTSGYVASPTLPHPRLHAVALFEGSGLTISLDRRRTPFQQTVFSVGRCQRPQPAERAAAFGDTVFPEIEGPR
jgi:hypothetical protein